MPAAARLVLLALASTLASHAQTATPLAAQITTLLAEPTAARAHWGIAVTELDGTPIYGLDEAKLFRPASNAKLFTTAAAMALLGPDATVSTTVEGDMDANGIVQHDLVLVGHGDANFGADDVPYIAPKLRPKTPPPPPTLRDLDELVDKLKKAGLKQVLGNVVGDDADFPYQPVVESWDVGDLVWGYGAPVSALSIADNELKLTVTPVPGSLDRVGQSTYATVELEQYGLPFYSVRSEVMTTAPGSKTDIAVEHLLPHVIRVFGTIAQDAKPDIEHISIDEPALFAATALRLKLVASGIQVVGVATANHFRSTIVRPIDPTRCDRMTVGDAKGTACAVSCLLRPSGHVLASHTSPALSGDVTLTLKVSQNLHAELLSHRVGGRAACPDTSVEGGRRLTRAFLEHAGIDSDDFVFYDGSGLSGHDLITPRVATQLLAYATKQPWFAQWKAALPVGGEDASLASRFPNAPLKDHVFAKTGTLGESRALSGYLDCASGKQVIFSILVDNHAPSGSNDRDVMDKIVAAIAATN